MDTIKFLDEIGKKHPVVIKAVSTGRSLWEIYISILKDEAAGNAATDSTKIDFYGNGNTLQAAFNVVIPIMKERLRIEGIAI